MTDALWRGRNNSLVYRRARREKEREENSKILDLLLGIVRFGGQACGCSLPHWTVEIVRTARRGDCGKGKK